MLNKHCLYQTPTIQLSSTQLTDKTKLSLLFTALRENTALTVGFLKGKKKKIGIYQGFEVWFKQDRASLVAQLVKNPPAMWETWVLSLDWEDPLEKRLSTPVVWPGEFHGLYSPWDCKESDTTERLSLSVQFSSVQLLSRVHLFVTP